MTQLSTAEATSILRCTRTALYTWAKRGILHPTKVNGRNYYDPEEVEYNILVALCRLVEVYNKRLSGRYDFYPARQIYRLPALLEGIAHDYRIDIIIDKAI